jgi:hypothetical protein
LLLRVCFCFQCSRRRYINRYQFGIACLVLITFSKSSSPDFTPSMDCGIPPGSPCRPNRTGVSLKPGGC